MNSNYLIFQLFEIIELLLSNKFSDKLEDFLISSGDDKESPFTVFIEMLWLNKLLKHSDKLIFQFEISRLLNFELNRLKLLLIFVWEFNFHLEIFGK